MLTYIYTSFLGLLSAYLTLLSTWQGHPMLNQDIDV
jgi:hypothetical protein